MAYGGFSLACFISFGVHTVSRKYINIHTLWLLMLVLVLLSYVMGKLSVDTSGLVLLILLTVLIKGIIIIREYMELKGVSLLWRVFMYGWLWVVVGTIFVTFLID